MNRWSVAALLTLAAGSTVSADVILSNYPPTNDTNTTAGVSSTRRKAMSFSMPAGPTYDITSITLRLQGYTSPSDVAILEIRDHTGSTTAPGTTVVGTFVAPASSNTAAGDFVFMPSGAVTLLPGTSYWICLYAGDATNTFDWRGSSPAIVPTGIATYGGQSLFSTTSGSTWTTSTTINTFSIDGVPSGASGACCLSSGAANCVITSAAGCAAQGGTYQGDGSTCATANCP
ncbi:MAG: hypothetical protein KF678_13485, partial [Phycisphaeraceae bacterium]|nr:hypothetical protein [Phycisphaeraceae bacterium]